MELTGSWTLPHSREIAEEFLEQGIERGLLDCHAATSTDQSCEQAPKSCERVALAQAAVAQFDTLSDGAPRRGRREPPILPFSFGHAGGCPAQGNEPPI